MNNRKVIVVIPALDEKDTIADVVCCVKRYVDEVIVVDDCSVDGTAILAEEQGALVLRHERTQGYDKSIDDGFVLAAERDAVVIVTFDADGQHDPDDIPGMIDPLLSGEADVVVGRRSCYARAAEHLFKFVAMKKAGINDPLCGFKAYRAEVFRDVGYFDRIGSIGTQLMFEARHKGYRVVERDIRVSLRVDHSRFGNRWRANLKIFMAMIRILRG